MSTKKDADHLVWGFFCGGRYRARTATTTTAACGRNREELLGQRSDFSRPRQGAEEKSANATRKAAHSAVSKATVRLCLARGSQRLGMSTKKDADHLVWGFFFVVDGTGLEQGGGNREPRLGPRSDFSKPCQGAAEKSANATRTGTSRQIPSRFPTRRNVYQERCRQTFGLDTFLWWRYRTRTGTSKGRVSPSWEYPAFC